MPSENISLLFPRSIPPQGGRQIGAPRLARAATEIDLVGIARRLRIVHRPKRAIIAIVRLMIDKRGFPLPRTPRFIKGEPVTGSQAVHAGSIWDRDLVDLWFDGDNQPPALAARAADQRRENTRATLQARARELVA